MKIFVNYSIQFVKPQKKRKNMTEYETRGNEIKDLSKSLVLDFMQKNENCKSDQQGLNLAEIFRMCGFDWGEKKNATSSHQQYWVVALFRELEAKDKVQRDPLTKKWKLK